MQGDELLPDPAGERFLATADRRAEREDLLHWFSNGTLAPSDQALAPGPISHTDRGTAYVDVIVDLPPRDTKSGRGKRAVNESNRN